MAISKEDLKVYAGVYAVAAKNMEEKCGRVPFCRKVWMRHLGRNSKTINMKGWDRLSDSEAIEAAYVFLLGRFPSKEEMALHMTPAEPARALLSGILDSAEFRNRKERDGVSAINNPYQENANGKPCKKSAPHNVKRRRPASVKKSVHAAIRHKKKQLSSLRSSLDRLSRQLKG